MEACVIIPCFSEDFIQKWMASFLLIQRRMKKKYFLILGITASFTAALMAYTQSDGPDYADISMDPTDTPMGMDPASTRYSHVMRMEGDESDNVEGATMLVANTQIEGIHPNAN